jgi:hypothetical protein
MLLKREQTMRLLFKVNHPGLTDPMEVIEKYLAKRKLRLLDLFHQARPLSVPVILLLMTRRWTRTETAPLPPRRSRTLSRR